MVGGPGRARTRRVEIDNYRPAAFMAEVWSDWIERAHERPPRGTGPLRSASARARPRRACSPADPDVVADWYAGLVAERGMPLGLAAVERGADAMAVMGWQGALNHNEWTSPLAAVVRSWEEQVRVRVVGMGFNTLDLSVAAPPGRPRTTPCTSPPSTGRSAPTASPGLRAR